MAYKRRENLETLIKHYLSPDIKHVLKVTLHKKFSIDRSIYTY